MRGVPSLACITAFPFIRRAGCPHPAAPRLYHPIPRADASIGPYTSFL